MRRWPARRFAGLPAATGFIWCAGACLALFGGWQPGSVLLLSMAIVALAAAGIDMVAVGERLQQEGLAQFEQAFAGLLELTA